MEMLKEIVYYWVKGNYILIPLAFCAFFIFYLSLRSNFKLNDYYKNLNYALSKVEFLMQRNNEKSFQIPGRFHFLHHLFRFLPQHKGESALTEFFEEVSRKEADPIYRELIILGALITAAPLLGLLGTVLGMIQTFEVLSQKSSYSSSLIAEGISQALITTQFGLIIALPGMFGLSHIRKKIKLLEVELQNLKYHIEAYYKKQKILDKVERI